MNIAIFISFLPIIILLFIILPQQKKKAKKIVINKIIKKERRVYMSKEVFKNLMGKNCLIYSIDQYSEGKITEINDNWLKIETKKNIEIINIEFIEKIEVKD